MSWTRRDFLKRALVGITGVFVGPKLKFPNQEVEPQVIEPDDPIPAVFSDAVYVTGYVCVDSSGKTLLTWRQDGANSAGSR